MDFVDRLDSVQVIDAGVKTNFVEYNDAGSFCLSIEFPHERIDVAGGDNVGLALDGGTDNSGVIGIGD